MKYKICAILLAATVIMLSGCEGFPGGDDFLQWSYNHQNPQDPQDNPAGLKANFSVQFQGNKIAATRYFNLATSHRCWQNSPNCVVIHGIALIKLSETDVAVIHLDPWPLHQGSVERPLYEYLNLKASLRSYYHIDNDSGKHMCQIKEYNDTKPEAGISSTLQILTEPASGITETNILPNTTSPTYEECLKLLEYGAIEETITKSSN